MRAKVKEERAKNLFKQELRTRELELGLVQRRAFDYGQPCTTITTCRYHKSRSDLSEED